MFPVSSMCHRPIWLSNTSNGYRCRFVVVFRPPEEIRRHKYTACCIDSTRQRTYPATTPIVVGNSFSLPVDLLVKLCFQSVQVFRTIKMTNIFTRTHNTTSTESDLCITRTAPFHARNASTTISQSCINFLIVVSFLLTGTVFTLLFIFLFGTRTFFKKKKKKTHTTFISLAVVNNN